MKFEITGTAIEYANSVMESELKKTLKSIRKSEYDEFADRCRVCFEKYLAGEMEQAKWWSNHAELVRERNDH